VFFPGKPHTVKYSTILADIYISLCQLLIISRQLLLIELDCKMKTCLVRISTKSLL